MNFSFDHLVWFYKRPEEAIFPLKEKGIHAVMGGRHELWGTYNSLAYFDLSYIEFLGIENLSIADQHEENRLVTEIVQRLSGENREGPAKIAIRTDDINAVAEKLKQEGLKVYGPLPGERIRADGELIRWSLLFAESDSEELSMPFFIQWEKKDEERLMEFQTQGLVVAHTIGAHSKFESVGFVVRNLNNTVKNWGKWLNLEVSEEYDDFDLNARCRKVKLSGTSLLFCSPLGTGLVEKVLKEKGETPFLVNLNQTNQPHCLLEMMNGYWRFY